MILSPLLCTKQTAQPLAQSTCSS